MFAKLSVPLLALTLVLVLLISGKAYLEGQAPPAAVPVDGSRGSDEGPTFKCNWDKAGSLAADTATGGKEPTKVGNKAGNAVQSEGQSGQGLFCRGRD